MERGVHLFETEPGSQQTPFRIAHPAKYDPVSALYQKRGPKVHHRKHHQLFLRFRKAACSSRNLPGIGNRTGFVLRIPSFSGRKSRPIAKASDFRQRLLLFLFILHFLSLSSIMFVSPNRFLPFHSVAPSIDSIKWKNVVKYAHTCKT